MATSAQAAADAAADDGGVGSPSWFDRIVTPLNACSLETYAPIPMRTMRRRPSSAPNDDDDDDDDDDAIDNNNIPLVVPLVIGCYQLNEPSEPKPADDGDGKESEEEGDDDHDDHGRAAAAVDVDVEKSSRSGELRLYMIPEFSSSSSSSVGRVIGGEGGGVGPMFGDAAAPVPCRRVAKMESGVLDGKWRRQTRMTSRGGDARDSSGSGSGSGSGAPLFACACASGRIHLHSLEYDFEEEEDDDDDDDEKKKERSSSSSSWGLSRVASSDGPPPSGSSSASSPSPLCLSLAWDDFPDDNDGNHHHNHRRSDSNDESHRSIDRIVSSYSDGSVALHDVVHVHARSEKNSDREGKKWTTTTTTTSIEERHRWNAHAMFGCPSEVWTCSFLRGDKNVVMSGADDCKLKIWDVRQTLRPMHAIGDSEFGAGVTAISPHPSLCHVFAVGSYDQVVRVYDARKMNVPVARVEVGGGVWRIKWHPSCYWNSDNDDKDDDGVVDDDDDDGVETTMTTMAGGAGCRGTILVAAMHGGCRVVDFPSLTMGAARSSSGEDNGADVDDDDDDDDDVAAVSGSGAEILSKFTAHESMAYGADWVWFGRRQSKCNRKDAAAASCSFYDRRAFLWDPYGRQ